MKELLDYNEYMCSMGELLQAKDFSFDRDYTPAERIKLKEQLENYIYEMGGSGSRAVAIDLKKFYLKIQGADEASYLFNLI